MRRNYFNMERAEKNVLSKKFRLNRKEQPKTQNLSFLTGLILILLIFVLFGAVCLIDRILPEPLRVSDEIQYPERFIAERAQSDLKLLYDLGVRLTGSYENEKLAVDLLKRKIEIIQNEAHSNQTIEMDLQVVSGSYYLDYHPNGALSAYANVQNVIVKLHSKNNSRYSLLVNAHFDSAPTSPGGSDDGINCATMLEILRKISKTSIRPDHNIIFLFNGAEETPLQASHGFITKHKWASEVQVVVNLEAAGAGGKEILFQAGPERPWLLKYYQNVPHPNGQAAGEELFQTGLIPSDTDFRIFRDFGNAIGMDFAFARDGYRYHTKYDGFYNIPLGSYQHVGDNMLNLIQNLANAPELTNTLVENPEGSIYYDVLGIILINYSQTIAIILHCLVSLISLFITVKSFYEFDLGLSIRKSIIYISLTIGIILASWIFSGVVVYIIAVFLDLVRFSMSWYRNPWLIFGLYVIPIVSCCIGTLLLFNKFFPKNNIYVGGVAQIQLHTIRFIWMTLLLIGTCLNFRFIYAIFIPFTFQTVSFVIIHIFCLQRSNLKWQIINLTSTIIPTMFLMHQSIQIMGVIIPICGRMGSDRNPELIIGILTLLLTIAIISYYIPIMALVHRAWILLAGLSIIFLIFLIMVFTPVGFQYSGNSESPAPERLWILHTGRVFRNNTNHIVKRDSGFFILNLDRNAPYTVKKYSQNFTVKSVEQDCDEYLFCGLPVVHSRAIPILRDSTWIPALEPTLDTPVSLQLNSKTTLSDLTVRFNFTATGPSNMLLFVSPRHGSSLNQTSLAPNIANYNTIIWNGRPAYVIIYTWGYTSTPLVFSIDFNVLSKRNEKSIMDIAITGRFLNEKRNRKTSEYTQFLQQFPDWVDIVASIGTYESWVY